ncbi:MAG: dephospho-CoA kinase [Treponema sp.]|nr:dephospho-CoA kinase [Treponema sp.]
MTICVAGPIAAGKNYVCSILEERGFLSVDADPVIHQIIKEKEAEIFSRFCKPAAACAIDIKNPDGSLNRRALGELLFKTPELLAEQEKILYPEFESRINQMIDAAEKDGRDFAINATLLYKTPSLLKRCKKIIYVDAPVLVRAYRIAKRDKLPTLQIFRRIKSQKGLYAHYKNFAAQNGIEIVKVKNFSPFDSKRNPLYNVSK